MAKDSYPPIGKRVVQKYEKHDASHTGTVISGEPFYWHIRLDNGQLCCSPAFGWESEVLVRISEEAKARYIARRGGMTEVPYTPPPLNPHWQYETMFYLVGFDDDGVGRVHRERPDAI